VWKTSTAVTVALLITLLVFGIAFLGSLFSNILVSVDPNNDWIRTESTSLNKGIEYDY